MVMMVSVIAVALHLFTKLTGGRAECQIFFLPGIGPRFENGAVRKGMRFTMAVALGCGLLAGAAQARSSQAQYGDRDNTRAHQPRPRLPRPRRAPTSITPAWISF